MRLFRLKSELEQFLQNAWKQDISIGFVPTMGALHEGHLTLFRRSLQENRLTVGSIFVNPIQFNNSTDLEKYPVVPEKDIALLESIGVDVLFMPTAEEMYPEPPKEHYDFGALESVMEGKQRPGHFNGVAVVVNRLFELVKPTRAYFGMKDFQQLTIIQDLVSKYKIPVEIVPCAIVRESDGLALSSRNMRLSQQARQIAPKIYDTLRRSLALKGDDSVANVQKFVEHQLALEPAFELEYFELVDSKTLQPVTLWSGKAGVVGCVVVWLDGVRLIDNIQY